MNLGENSAWSLRYGIRLSLFLVILLLHSHTQVVKFSTPTLMKGVSIHNSDFPCSFYVVVCIHHHVYRDTIIFQAMQRKIYSYHNNREPFSMIHQINRYHYTHFCIILSFMYVQYYTSVNILWRGMMMAIKLCCSSTHRRRPIEEMCLYMYYTDRNFSLMFIMLFMYHFFIIIIHKAVKIQAYTWKFVSIFFIFIQSGTMFYVYVTLFIKATKLYSIIAFCNVYRMILVVNNMLFKVYVNII